MSVVSLRTSAFHQNKSKILVRSPLRLRNGPDVRLRERLIKPVASL